MIDRAPKPPQAAFKHPSLAPLCVGSLDAASPHQQACLFPTHSGAPGCFTFHAKGGG